MTPAHMPSSAAVRTTSLPNRRSGIMGSSARRSCTMNATTNTAAATNQTSVEPSVHPSRPTSRPIIKVLIPPTRKVAPTTSSRACRRWNGSRRATWQIAMTARQAGTLMKKIHGQVQRSMMKPPTSGPRIAEPAKAIVK
jgi:hypothetical protein